MTADPARPSVTVAIHQPNYLPWLGYFEKIFRADVFVFLDCVQFSVQSYTQRVRVLCQGRSLWLTVPIQKSGRHGQAICDVECHPDASWAKKHLGTLQASYGRHPYYGGVAPALHEVLSAPPTRLARLNQDLIQTLAAGLGARCRFVRASDLALGELHSNELLAAIVERVGGTAYLFGGGATKYQETEPFERRRIALVKQAFTAMPYAQVGVGTFLPGLSIIDALFNLGYSGTAALLRGDAIGVSKRA